MTEKKVEIADEILEYWIDNPEAQDTLEGIVSWWLRIRDIRRHTPWVAEALATLVKDGLVIAQKRTDFQTYYKLNKEDKRIIERLGRKS